MTSSGDPGHHCRGIAENQHRVCGKAALHTASVELFILSRNRLDYLPEALNSALRQDYAQLKVVVSDNSTDEKVSDYVRGHHPSVEIRRRSGLTAYEHLNQVFSEVTATYFMIFHDDDVLEENAVSELVATLEAHPRASCAAGNARIIHGRRFSKEPFNASLKRDLEIRDPRELIERYFDFSLGVNPFPGYLYRRNLVADLRFDVSEGGQYTDLTFLIQVCERGAIEWLAKSLMNYRKHGLNHSASASLTSAKTVIRFAEKRGYLEAGSEIAKLFRFWNHFFYIKNSRRGHVALKRRHKALVLVYFAAHPSSFLRRTWQKLKTKLRS